MKARSPAIPATKSASGSMPLPTTASNIRCGATPRSISQRAGCSVCVRQPPSPCQSQHSSRWAPTKPPGAITACMQRHISTRNGAATRPGTTTTTWATTRTPTGASPARGSTTSWAAARSAIPASPKATRWAFVCQRPWRNRSTASPAGCCRMPTGGSRARWIAPAKGLHPWLTSELLRHDRDHFFSGARLQASARRLA